MLFAAVKTDWLKTRFFQTKINSSPRESLETLLLAVHFMIALIITCLPAWFQAEWLSLTFSPQVSAVHLLTEREMK